MESGIEWDLSARTMSNPKLFAAGSEVRSGFPTMNSSILKRFVLKLGNGGRRTRTNKEAAVRGHCLAHITKDGQSFCISPVMDDQT